MLLRVLALVLCSVSMFVNAASNDQIQQAAQQGINQYLINQPLTILKDFGIEKAINTADIQLDKPLAIYIIEPSLLANNTEHDYVISDISRQADHYLVPVFYKKRTLAMLAVEQNTQGKWQVAAMSYQPLLQALQPIQQYWLSEYSYNIELYVHYQSKQYFYHIPQFNQVNLTPLHLPYTSLINSLGESAVMNLYDTVSLLKQ